MTTVTIEQALAQAIEHQKAGRSAEAEAVYRAVLAVQPHNPTGCHNLGLILLNRREPDAAIALIRTAIASNPQVAAFHNTLGSALKARGRLADALAAYDEALRCDPADAIAHSNRGIALNLLARSAEAEAAFREAIGARPAYDAGWCNLGGVLAKQERHMEALVAFREAIRLNPGNLEAHFGAASTLLKTGGLQEASAIADGLATAAGHPAFPRVRFASLLAGCGRRGEAKSLLLNCLETDPSDAAGASLAMASLGLEATPERASDAMMARLYAERARYWDAASEGYRAAELVARALIAHTPSGGVILDAGCGTGLAGPLLRHCAERLEGVDLSGAMLAEASAKKVYDALFEAELTAFLRARPEGYRSISCAATLLHFGNLEPPLTAACGALQPGGAIALTVLPHQVDMHGYAADPENPQGGIFRHGANYLRGASEAAGFDVISLTEEVHEHTDGKPVTGLLAVLRRPAVA